MLRQHPLVLAHFLNRHLTAQIEATRTCWRSVPTDLDQLGLPELQAQTRAACERVGAALKLTAQQAALIEQGLQGRPFVRAL